MKKPQQRFSLITRLLTSREERQPPVLPIPPTGDTTSLLGEAAATLATLIDTAQKRLPDAAFPVYEVGYRDGLTDAYLAIVDLIATINSPHTGTSKETKQ
ncbi:hypothetical protein [Mobiluncus curtisii]|uniref:hypothetical protein n=1 Tax=Mobiluncus curtisii TaxID=2051 RepID=UPI0014701F26|nr:hypothetical protein [Mobiluncus curtisii]MCU9986631.1 hypothetical protein [Mobiluncus curtisii]MCV0020023.1 hypothetical protein [Mobiluncus curtisii]NMX12809.1 hypothetical protein [Mobiluncus curtisii]